MPDIVLSNVDASLVSEAKTVFTELTVSWEAKSKQIHDCDCLKENSAKAKKVKSDGNKKVGCYFR